MTNDEQLRVINCNFVIRASSFDHSLIHRLGGSINNVATEIDNMKNIIPFLTLVILTAQYASAETRLRNICRVKGQEENILQGYGLVVGLNGTGAANDGPTMRAMARAMELLGSPLSTTGRLDAASLAELKGMKNASLVIVQAQVPATGARRGEKLNCSVSAINGKSLVGGQLAFATLLGPNLQDRRVFAVCSGPVQIDDAAVPTAGRVHDGCQMEQDVYTPFHKDGFITLVLDKNHAGFHTAAEVARKVRDDWGGYYGNQAAGAVNTQHSEDASISSVIADDATNIRVRIPTSYENDPVAFAGQVLETIITEEDPEARVVMNPRTGSIVISGDVRIGDVVVVHKNTVIEAGTSAEFTALYDDQNISPSLNSLVTQLKYLKVPPEDVMDIIRVIERDGKLHGKLIVE